MVKYNLSLMRSVLLVLLFIVSSTSITFSQGYGKSNNPAYKQYYDSLMQMDYSFKLPYLGKQAYKRGYDLPSPWAPVLSTSHRDRKSPLKKR